MMPRIAPTIAAMGAFDGDGVNEPVPRVAEVVDDIAEEGVIDDILDDKRLDVVVRDVLEVGDDAAAMTELRLNVESLNETLETQAGKSA